MTTFMIIASAIYVLMMGAFVVYAFHRGWTPWIRERCRPVERVLADVAQKEEQREFIPMFQREEVTARLIAFKCQDGKTRVFSIQERLFNRLMEEEHGILLYRGDTFVAFESTQSGADSDDVYRRMVR